jgi:hypothetical protein
MQRLIPVLNELHDVFSAIGRPPVDLPLIVAIGAQSSGKSSVVAALAGIDVLPKGAGLCTRRPVVLQLYHVTQSAAGELPCQVFTRAVIFPVDQRQTNGCVFPPPAVVQVPHHMERYMNGWSLAINPSKSFMTMVMLRKKFWMKQCA